MSAMKMGWYHEHVGQESFLEEVTVELRRERKLGTHGSFCLRP